MKDNHIIANNIRKLLFLLISVLCIILPTALFLMPFSSQAAKEITSKAQLNDPSITIGTSLGSVSELSIREEFPEANISYYNDTLLGYQEIAQGKLDAYVYDVRQIKLAIESGQKGIRLLDETMNDPIRIAVGISGRSDIPDIEEKINSFIHEVREDGTLDDMFDRWVIKGEYAFPDIPSPAEPQYHLIVGTSGIVPPYSYYQGDELYGYDIELAMRLAAWLNASLEFQVYDYSAIINAAKSGKVDCIMANLQISPERAEVIIYSDVLYEEEQGIVVRDYSGSSNASASNFLSSIASSFNKTFIKEKRWTLFVSGITTTLMITISSVILGTLLGFIVFMICRGGNRIANLIKKICMWLVQGMPVVVFLMVLYYVIFGKIDISSVPVAIIGFSIIFAAAVIGMLQVGVDAIDKGQYEAAYALGYSYNRTFYRIILPQILPHIMPIYQGEVIGLIKATAIVGYIAIQDLTKMGDIVRNRTYEAFFPLIAVTIIYFLLEAILRFILSRITRSIDYKKRSIHHILRGVKIDDQN